MQLALIPFGFGFILIYMGIFSYLVAAYRPVAASAMCVDPFALSYASLTARTGPVTGLLTLRMHRKETLTPLQPVAISPRRGVPALCRPGACARRLSRPLLTRSRDVQCPRQPMGVCRIRLPLACLRTHPVRSLIPHLTTLTAQSYVFFRYGGRLRRNSKFADPTL